MTLSAAFEQRAMWSRISEPERSANFSPALTTTALREQAMAKPADTTNPIPKKCSVEGCERKYFAKGYCSLHDGRVRRTGAPGPAQRLHNQPLKNRTCSLEGCDRRHYAKGLCNLHWTRLTNGGEPGPAGQVKISNGELLKWLEDHVAYDGEACLTWPFCRSKDGRPGAARYKGKQIGAARLMCILAHGEPPFPNADSAHSCGKGHEGCVAPNHLSWKTRQGNVQDTYEHDTIMRGERHYAARLTKQDVIAIRSDPRTDEELAKVYECHSTNIHAIRIRRSWKHVE